MTATDATLYEVRGGAAWITLNRPEARNALSATLVTEVYDHLNAANEDDAVRSIVLTGAPPAFCAGADLKNPPGSASDGGRAVGMDQMLTAILESAKPVIAAVNGAAFAGGLGLVGASDIVITADNVKFSFSEVRIGVIPAMIAVVCVPKLGPHHAKRLFMTGDRFTGTEAVDMGFAHKAAPADKLIETVEAEIAMINLGGPIAVAESKKLVNRVQELSIEEGFRETAPWSLRMFKSDEGQEGMAAFREKRKPAWAADKG